MRFVHTADWQLGKPFARISDPDKRALARQARIEAVRQIGLVAQNVDASFVVVAVDLFDSPHADKATAAAACDAIGQIGRRVIVIPGNHDHAGPGTAWEQDFFRREVESLAPNLELLVDPAAYERTVISLSSGFRRRSERRLPTSGMKKYRPTLRGSMS
jgi:DNA repair exonuclease SbcCD nuclease subunit